MSIQILAIITVPLFPQLQRCSSVALLARIAWRREMGDHGCSLLRFSIISSPFSEARIQHCNPASSAPNSMLPVVLLAKVAEIGGRKGAVIPSLQSSNHLLRSLFRTPCSALNSSSLNCNLPLGRLCSFKGAAGGSGGAGGDGGGDGVFLKSYSNAI